MPSSKPYSIYAGGYNEDKKATLEATKLPEKLRCKICKKLKVLDGYSKNQLLDFKHRLAANPRLANPTAAHVRCRQCTPGQVHELECSQCGAMKGLNGFTKAQRRDPDNARCILCVNEDLVAPTAGDTVPEAENSENEEDDSEDDGRTNPYAEASLPDVSVSNTRAVSHAATSLDAFGKLKMGDSDVDDNPYAPQSRIKSVSGSTVGDSKSSIAPRSNFARPKNDNAKNMGGLIQVSQAAKDAVGRQIYRGDSDSDDDYGYI